jgi:hypothetical protein
VAGDFVIDGVVRLPRALYLRSLAEDRGCHMCWTAIPCHLLVKPWRAVLPVARGLVAAPGTILDLPKVGVLCGWTVGQALSPDRSYSEKEPPTTCLFVMVVLGHILVAVQLSHRGYTKLNAILRVAQ